MRNGFFSVPIARIVGETGKVIGVDLQEKMIQGLIRRSKKAGLSDRIDARTCQQNSLGLMDLGGTIDFALAFALVHEVPDKERLLSEINDTMKHAGKFLIAEPKAHVSRSDFDKTVSLAQGIGFEVIDGPAIRRNHAILLRKPQNKNKS
jgi:ubiquinone/menaquinone biosynthesis C-methylase UbiE